MNRETIIKDIMNRWHVRNTKELMNELQEHGVASDNCVTIEDVCDSDLVRAYNREAK